MRYTELNPTPWSRLHKQLSGGWGSKQLDAPRATSGLWALSAAYQDSWSETTCPDWARGLGGSRFGP